MPFNISEFRANINKYGGLNTTSKFYVLITPPRWYSSAQGDNGDIVPNLQFFCDGANIPSMSLELYDYRPQGFGLNTKRPNNLNFGPLNTTFLCDSQGRVVRFFQRWIQEVINYSSVSKGDLASYKNLAAFEAAYPDQYQTTISLLHFSHTEPDHYTKYDFFDCFPQQTGDIQLGWEQNDTIAKLPVEFAYSHYTQFKETLNFPVTGGSGRGIGFFERAAQIGSVYGILSNLNKPKSIQDALNQALNVKLLIDNF